jgi:hypothetical protein
VAGAVAPAGVVREPAPKEELDDLPVLNPDRRGGLKSSPMSAIGFPQSGHGAGSNSLSGGVHSAGQSATGGRLNPLRQVKHAKCRLYGP